MPFMAEMALIQNTVSLAVSKNPQFPSTAVLLTALVTRKGK